MAGRAHSEFDRRGGVGELICLDLVAWLFGRSGELDWLLPVMTKCTMLLCCPEGLPRLPVMAPWEFKCPCTRDFCMPMYIGLFATVCPCTRGVGGPLTGAIPPDLRKGARSL